MAKKTFPKSRAKTAFGLLSEIKKLITEEPKRYDQSDVLVIRNRDYVGRDDYFPSCGTIGCVAGWVAALKLPNAADFSGGTILEEAEKILGITYDQSDELFAGDAAGSTSNRNAHARRGVRHIEKFQNKYAAQLKAQRV